MIDDKLHNGIEEIRKFTMTDGEKERMLGAIFSSPLQVAESAKGTSTLQAFVSAIRRNRLVSRGVSLVMSVLSLVGKVHMLFKKICRGIFFIQPK